MAGTRRAAPPRFIAFCGEPASLRAWLSSLVPSPDRPERLSRILDCTDLVIYVSPETRFATFGTGAGAVLGGHRGSAEALSAWQSESRATDAARPLLPGSYAAFVRLPGKVLVIRGPGGQVAVRHAKVGKINAFFSHAGLRFALPTHVSRVDRDGPASGPDGTQAFAGLRPGEWRRFRTEAAFPSTV
jgi:hypothetical protein